MAVCYFDRVYDNEHKYKCDYEVLDGEITVAVDYDIMDEVAPVNGIRAVGPDTEYANRDILIIDHDKKINYLLKDAFYNGSSSVYGNPDGGTKTKFTTSIYFYSNYYTGLADLKETPKISSITIVSRDLLKYISERSLSITDTEDSLVINLDKKGKKETRQIGTVNIKEISLQDRWSGGFRKEHDIVFDFTGHLELRLFRRVNYTEIAKYVYEIYIFLQIYTKRSFKIDEIKVTIDGVTYGMSIYMASRRTKPKKNKGEKSVQCDIMDFLERCYSSIPYRSRKSDVRNIPYIIVKRDRSLEDSFLMYYRFIECFYKKQDIPEIKTKFIAYSLNKNYVEQGKKLPLEHENLTREIIKLRNHYVHSGYYIANESLRITFDDASKNYTAKADVDWIYKRTKILYECSIDIIFRDMLKYEKYDFF